MLKLVAFLLVLPLAGIAHPGIGIVKDSRGNIFYTDLHQVWRISKGVREVVVPGVHTHELWIDHNDDLYGESSFFDEETGKFFHFMWAYRTNGTIDTVVGVKEQFIRQNFALAKDRTGNEYYLKRFLRPHSDTGRIYRRAQGGEEVVFAKGNFRDVNWLHPQEDGSLLYVSNNAIYRVDSSGVIMLIRDQVADQKPSFAFSGNPMVWGVWQDNTKNTYAAVFSDQEVKRIDAAGNMTVIYRSESNWTPLHGVFDNESKLWVLEGSDKNEVRVILADTTPKATRKTGENMLVYVIAGAVIVGVVVLSLKYRFFRSGSGQRHLHGTRI